MTIGGVAQVVLLNGAGVISVAPDTGAVLWEHEWAGTPIVQPAVTADGDMLVTTGDMTGGTGTRRLAVTRGPGGWTVAERWTSTGLKPYFNDYVVHNGLAFGFDGSILACIDLADGTRKWKGGRYGHGQLMLLPDQDVLLVLSEEGELALVKATPDQFTELARVPGDRGQDVESPGAGQRRTARAQRRGDGCVPAVAGCSLIQAWRGNADVNSQFPTPNCQGNQYAWRSIPWALEVGGWELTWSTLLGVGDWTLTQWNSSYVAARTVTSTVSVAPGGI